MNLEEDPTNDNQCFTKFPVIEEEDNPPISREFAKRIQKAGCSSFYEYYRKQIEKENNNINKRDVLIIDMPDNVSYII